MRSSKPRLLHASRRMIVTRLYPFAANGDDLTVRGKRELQNAVESLRPRWRHARPDIAGLEQPIARKTAEANENDAMAARLASGLPIPRQKRDLSRSSLNVAFSNKVAWRDSEQADSSQLRQLAVEAPPRRRTRPVGACGGI